VSAADPRRFAERLPLGRHSPFLAARTDPRALSRRLRQPGAELPGSTGGLVRMSGRPQSPSRSHTSRLLLGIPRHSRVALRTYINASSPSIRAVYAPGRTGPRQRPQLPLRMVHTIKASCLTGGYLLKGSTSYRHRARRRESAMTQSDGCAQTLRISHPRVSSITQENLLEHDK